MKTSISKSALSTAFALATLTACGGGGGGIGTDGGGGDIAGISQITSGLANAQFAAVKGTIATANTTNISATLVKLEDNNPAEGATVEAEGTITGGVLQANTLKLREGNTRIHATASNVNSTANTFDMTIAGQTVTVSVNTSTRLEDKVTGNPLPLATLANVGKCVFYYKVRQLVTCTPYKIHSLLG